ncbi:hypothetical protein [Longivirga aurantiaca]|uniref:Uncharacterized protein n=1 Tax=Longivirga aurantiaca TaxID=1837743 RepID=A0ABW1T589_9ACTN
MTSKSERSVAGDLGSTLLIVGSFNHSAPAYRSTGCGTVVVPGPQKRER